MRLIFPSFIHFSRPVPGIMWSRIRSSQPLQLFLRLRSLVVTSADKDVLSDTSSFLRFRNDSRVIWRISLKPLFSCCKTTNKNKDAVTKVATRVPTYLKKSQTWQIKGKFWKWHLVNDKCSWSWQLESREHVFKEVGSCVQEVFHPCKVFLFMQL